MKCSLQQIVRWAIDHPPTTANNLHKIQFKFILLVFAPSQFLRKNLKSHLLVNLVYFQTIAQHNHLNPLSANFTK